MPEIARAALGSGRAGSPDVFEGAWVMDLQTLIAAGIVVASAVALVWRGVRALRRPSAGACGGCHACPAHQGTSTVATSGLWNGGDLAATAAGPDRAAPKGRPVPAPGQTTFVTLDVAPRSRPGA